MSTVSVTQNSDQSDSLSCPSELDFSLQPLRASTPHTSSISSSSKSTFENSESPIRPEISLLSESSSIEKAPMAEQGDLSGSMAAQGDVGSMAEQGDLSGSMAEQGDVSGSIAEQSDASGLYSDVVDVGDGDDDKETWPGFKLVGDNIDKTIEPRDMRINNQANSVHYFNVYAVRDRINFSHLSSNASMISPEDIKFDAFYPSSDDDNKLLLNFEILVTRILVKHLPGMEKLSSKVTDHISHKYSSNMTQKSKVVCSHAYVVANSTFVIVSLLM